MKKIKKITTRIALDGIFTAVAIALSFLESLLPDFAFLPPGAKLGLSNIVVNFAAMKLGFPDCLFLVLCKSGFVLFTRGAAAFFMSLSGGIASTLLLFLLLCLSERKKKPLSYFELSVPCAITHNLGQLLAASLYTSTNLFYYLPALLIFGILAGSLTGILLKITMPMIQNINE